MRSRTSVAILEASEEAMQSNLVYWLFIPYVVNWALT